MKHKSVLSVAVSLVLGMFFLSLENKNIILKYVRIIQITLLIERKRTATGGTKALIMNFNVPGLSLPGDLGLHFKPTVFLSPYFPSSINC